MPLFGMVVDIAGRDLQFLVEESGPIDTSGDPGHTNDGDASGVGAGTISENDQRDYKTITWGIQYFFNKKTKLMLNYEVRSAEAPNNKSAGPVKVANQILDDMSNRLSAQVTAIF